MRWSLAAWIAIAALSALAHRASAGAPLDLDRVLPDQPPDQLCDRLAADPFAGFGPEEWAKPFRDIDSYRAISACSQAAKANAEVPRFKLELALAYIAGEKRDLAKPLLDALSVQGDTSAMLALAYISPDGDAAELMRKAADAGNKNAMVLFGMSQLTGKGIPKSTIDGVRTIRKAADAGSTRAMMILAHFYNEGSYGVGFSPDEAKSLIEEAAKRGDPTAQAMLGNPE